MPTYRCYVLDKADKTSSYVSFEADDDSSALVRAAADVQASELYPILEVWNGKRIGGRVSQRDGKD